MKTVVFYLKDNVDDGDTIFVDLVKIYKNKRIQSKTNSHPQIEKLMNINFEKVINTDKTLPKFIQAFAKLIYTSIGDLRK